MSTASGSGSGRLGLLLAPGAGAGSDQSALVRIDEVAREQLGVAVRRFDFPYRLAGRRFPDRAPVLLERVRTVLVEFAAEAGVERVVVGGRSMGGRMCSMVAAESSGTSGVARGDGDAAITPEIVGVAAVSYPLHPPGKPDRLRTEHFAGLTMPVLFVSGDRDTFGTPDELHAAARAIPGEVTFRWIEGAGHDLRRRDDQVAELVADWLRKLNG